MKSEKLLFRITYRDCQDGEILTWEGRAYDTEHAKRLAFGDEGEYCTLVSMHFKANPLDKWEDSLA